MANRHWRSGYNSYNQLLQPVSYFAQPIAGYTNERKSFGAKSGYDDKRNRKEFQAGRRDRTSPSKRRSPYQRSHDAHGSFRKDSRKSHGGRHEVKAPRMTFDVKELSTYDVRHRYSRMYIPSDFFHASLKWQEVFPLYRPMKFGNDCEYQILNKEVQVEGLPTEETIVEPEDADSKYSAKVMLLSTPTMTELMKMTTKSGEFKDKTKNTVNRCIQFLVGTKGKNEPMAIGGAWSAELDGADPETDPNVLIKTAIRTCKSLTGIDLSKCRKWYKFMEISYYRPGDNHEDVKKEPEQPVELKEDKVETVVIYIPDVWSCSPDAKLWEELKAKFAEKLTELTPKEKVKENDDVSKETTEEQTVTKPEEVEEKKEVKTESSPQIDLANLKVVELRAKLSVRGLDTKGVKNVLIQRLNDALNKEKGIQEPVNKEEDDKKEVEEKKEPAEEAVVEEKKEMEVVPEPEEKQVVEPVVEITDKERQHLTKIYTLNEKPSIIVRPNTTAKEGRFDCAVMSLESLLEYRSDDQKEHVFEISVFAEQLNELVQRDALFYIYRSLLNMPEISVEHEEPEAKKAKVDETSKNEKTKIRKTKMIPDLYLLYCFSIFDPDNYGYIRDHVLEYFIHNLGLNLSRSQVKRLINKIPNRKGSLMYKEVALREVVEGSVDDIAMLKLQIENCQKLAELAQGNKSFFEDGESESVAREGSLEMLDKLEESLFKKMNCEMQLSLLMDEMEKLNNIQGQSGTVAAELKENIQKTQEKLEVEKQSHNKLLDSVKIYHELLQQARDSMEDVVSSICDQYELEKKAKEAEKMEAEESKEETKEEEKEKKAENA